eukprot:2827011-Lingulodinium_polyedra.AAC.1
MEDPIHDVAYEDGGAQARLLALANIVNEAPRCGKRRRAGLPKGDFVAHQFLLETAECYCRAGWHIPFLENIWTRARHANGILYEADLWHPPVSQRQHAA